MTIGQLLRCSASAKLGLPAHSKSDAIDPERHRAACTEIKNAHQLPDVLVLMPVMKIGVVGMPMHNWLMPVTRKV